MPIHDWPRVDAGIFHHFHHEWISTLMRALNGGLLPPGYYALAEQIAGGPIPDVLSLEDARPDRPPREDEGGVLLATRPPQVRFALTAQPERYTRRQSRIAIRHASGDRVVAVVEIVSPGNKPAGTPCDRSSRRRLSSSRRVSTSC